MIDLSNVEIRNEHIAEGRSFLRGDLDRLKPFDDPVDEAAAAPFMLLINGVFGVLAHKKFGPFYTDQQIVRYVAELRISRKKNAETEDFDPLVAEKTIRRALGDPAVENGPPPATDTDFAKMTSATNAVIEDLFSDWLGEETDEADVDRLLEEAVDYARQWQAAQRAGQVAERG